MFLQREATSIQSPRPSPQKSCGTHHKKINEFINQCPYKIYTNGVHPRHVINRPGRKMLIAPRVRKNSHSSPTARSHLATYACGTKTIVGKIRTAKDTPRSLTKYLAQILEHLRIDVHYVFPITRSAPPRPEITTTTSVALQTLLTPLTPLTTNTFDTTYE